MESDTHDTSAGRASEAVEASYYFVASLPVARSSDAGTPNAADTCVHEGALGAAYVCRERRCPEREMSFFSPKLYCLYVRNVHLNCMKIAVQCPIVFRNFACGALDKLSTFSPKFRFSLLTMTLMRLRLVVVL